VNHFRAFNSDCFAQDRHKELKLVSLELSGHENSENVSKFSLMSVKGMGFL
jgi:hypothetical protein